MFIKILQHSNTHHYSAHCTQKYISTTLHEETFHTNFNQIQVSHKLQTGEFSNHVNFLATFMSHGHLFFALLYCVTVYVLPYCITSRSIFCPIVLHHGLFLALLYYITVYLLPCCLASQFIFCPIVTSHCLIFALFTYDT